MIKMKKANLVLTVIFTLALYTSWVYAGGYSWTDKDGVRHSSDLSPSEYMEQKKKASQQADDELSPEVTQTLFNFNKKEKPVAPETDANKAPIAPDAEIKQPVESPPEYEPPQTKQKVTPPRKDKAPPKSETPPQTEKSAAHLESQTAKPAQKLPQPLSRERIGFYKNQLARLKELIKSQEKLIAEDVRTIGLIENRINQIKNIQGPKSDRLKDELQQAQKSLVTAKKRLKSDVRELQFLQSNVNKYQFKLKSALQQ